jgi:hypothetical protein
MKLSELHRIVDLYNRPDHYEDPEIMIRVKLPYATVGALPMVKVKSMNMGFDWEAGRFIIWPEEDLTPSDRDFAKQMRDMQERAYNSDYENRNLKAEIRRLKKLLKDQKDEPTN